MNEIYTRREAAVLLGVEWWRIDYAHASGQVPIPTLRLAGRPVYQQADIAALAEHFGVKPGGARPTEISPFAVRQVGESSWEIVGPEGDVVAWTTTQELAQRIGRSLSQEP